MTVVYLLLGLLAAFVGLLLVMRVVMVLRARAVQGKAAPSLTGAAGKAIRMGRPALFYFFSPSCGACHSMTPEIMRMRKQRRDSVFPIDISRDMDTARKFSVMATPTTICVSGGIVKKVLIGPQSKSVLEHLCS